MNHNAKCQSCKTRSAKWRVGSDGYNARKGALVCDTFACRSWGTGGYPVTLHRVVVQASGVKTWADGSGTWYAAVPGDVADPKGLARKAIRAELAARDAIAKGARLRVVEAPDHWLTTDRASRPVFMEA